MKTFEDDLDLTSCVLTAEKILNELHEKFNVKLHKNVWQII